MFIFIFRFLCRSSVVKMGIKRSLLSCLLLTVFKDTGAHPSPECIYIDSLHKILTCMPSGDPDVVLKLKIAPVDTHTEAIVLRGCGITELEQDSLQKTSLKYLDLAENKLKDLDNDLFKNSPSLNYLNVSNNRLSSIPINLFVKTPHLFVLDLKNNTIDKLVEGVFDSLVELHSLDLSWNNFLGQHLSSLIFVNNRHITYLSFAGTHMSGTPDNLLQSLEVLQTLDLNSCGVIEVPKFATQPNLKTLKELNLSSNKIKRITNENVFKNLHNLEILNIEQNELEYIDENVVAPLKTLKIINLSHNKLIHLSDSLFITMLCLENINLSHNLIPNIKVEMFLNNPLKILNISFNRLTYLPNSFSVTLKKPTANITEFYFHQNPWQCACLKEILYEVDHFNVIHKTDVPGYMRPACVTTRDIRCIRDDSMNDVFRNIYNNIVYASLTWSTISNQYS